MGTSRNGPSSAMRAFIITVLLSLKMDVTHGMSGFQPFTQYPVNEEFITLRENIGTQEAVTWFKGQNTEPVTKPKITVSTSQPKENDTFTLTCEVSHATMITWTRRGTSFSSQAKLSGDNKILTFSSIKRKDSGQYRCEAQNLLSKESSDPYSVTVAYGPDNVKVEGTSLLNPGYSITLTCSADSSPTPEYQWKLNGTVLGENTETYGISNAIHENEGLYTCTVTNTVTGRTATTSIYVNVTTDYIDPPLNSAIELTLGLIFFGLIFGVVGIIIGSVVLYRKCVTKRMNESSENRHQHIPVYENEQAARPKEESAYMGLQFRTEDIYTELKK